MIPDRDKLRLLVKCGPFPSDPEGKHYLAVEATINDIEVTTWDDLPVDMDAMKASSVCDGEFYLWNCSCGYPSCGGLREGIKVVHQNDVIRWKKSSPTGKGRDILEEFGELVFDKAAYVRTVTEALKEMKRQAFLRRDQGIAVEFLLRREEEVFWRSEDQVDGAELKSGKNRVKKGR